MLLFAERLCRGKKTINLNGEGQVVLQVIKAWLDAQSHSKMFVWFRLDVLDKGFRFHRSGVSAKVQSGWFCRRRL